MLAVIFEVEMKPGLEEQYFELAGKLRAELEAVDGFISIERFQSVNNASKYLSISFSGATSKRSRRGEGTPDTAPHRNAESASCFPTSVSGWPRSSAITGSPT